MKTKMYKVIKQNRNKLVLEGPINNNGVFDLKVIVMSPEKGDELYFGFIIEFPEFYVSALSLSEIYETLARRFANSIRRKDKPKITYNHLKSASYLMAAIYNSEKWKIISMSVDISNKSEMKISIQQDAFN